jgi:hypothetical protein
MRDFFNASTQQRIATLDTHKAGHVVGAAVDVIAPRSLGKEDEM